MCDRRSLLGKWRRPDALCECALRDLFEMVVAAASHLALHELDEVLLEAAPRGGVEESLDRRRTEVLEAPATHVDARAIREQQGLDVVLVRGAVPVIADSLAGTLGACRLPADFREELPGDGVTVVLEPPASVERRHEPDVVEDRRHIEHLCVERSSFGKSEQR